MNQARVKTMRHSS